MAKKTEIIKNAFNKLYSDLGNDLKTLLSSGSIARTNNSWNSKGLAPIGIKWTCNSHPHVFLLEVNPTELSKIQATPVICNRFYKDDKGILIEYKSSAHHGVSFLLNSEWGTDLVFNKAACDLINSMASPLGKAPYLSPADEGEMMAPKRGTKTSPSVSLPLGTPKTLSGIATECKELLEANFNIILSGAPGTGKTYMAHKIARVITGGDKSRIGFVQFHPSYDYTDFVEGLRPTPPIGGTVGFECKDGIFKAFCEKALCALETYNSSAASSYVVPGSVASSYASGKGGSSLAAKIEHIYIIIVDGIKAGEKWTITTVNGIEKELFVNKNGNLYVKNETREIVLTLAILLRISETLKTKKDVIAAKNFRNITGIKNWDTDLRAIMILIYSIIESEEPYTDAVNSEMSSNQLDNPNISSDIIRGTAQSEEYPYFVFIIDEINRGEISKVFGELFFSVDPGYRGKSGAVRTQYANMSTEPNAFDNALGISNPKDCGHFFVPENVYIIGTMNDIDRSVDSMDFAMRRRFMIKEIKAKDTQSEMLSEPGVIAKMDALNAVIEGSSNNEIRAKLGSSYSLGASYFQKYDKYNDFNKLWDNHLEGILREYLRGTQTPEKDLETLKDAYDKA